MSEQLPETVPALTANNIHKGNYDGPNETHCLLGWAAVAGFNDSDYGGRSQYSLNPRVRETILSTAKAVRASGVRRGCIPTVNDSEKNSRSLLARIWNRAMRKLGYVKRGNRFVRKARKA